MGAKRDKKLWQSDRNRDSGTGVRAAADVTGQPANCALRHPQMFSESQAFNEEEPVLSAIVPETRYPYTEELWLLTIFTEESIQNG